MKRCLAILIAVLQIVGMLIIPAAAEQTPDIKVEQWNVVLGDDIGANFYLNVSAELAKIATVNVTVADETTSYRLSEPNEKGFYPVSVRVAAAQMTEEITLQLAADETVYDIGSYTIKEYAAEILASNYGNNTKMLVKHMLNYGAAAQQYFGVNTDSLANAGYELTEENQLPSEYPALEVSGELDGVKFYGASLVMDSRVAVRYYFAADSVEGLAFSVNGNTYTAVMKNGLFYVEIPGILPQNYSESILLSAKKGDEELAVAYSPMTYIVRMSEKGSTTMQALVDAMCGYHNAAVTYANHKDVLINLPSITGGKVTADKESYYVGDTVRLTVTPDTGMAHKLYINGEPLLVDANSQYSFAASETVYDITGSFEPKENWFWTADWNLTNQGHSVAHAPAHTSGEKTGELVPEKGVCNGVSVLVKDPSYGDQKDYAIVLKMSFADGQKAEVRLIDRDDNGNYCLQAFGDNLAGNWKALYWLTALENAAVKNGDGVWFGMTMEGTVLRLTINKAQVWEMDLSAEGITAETDIDQIKLQAYNFGYEVDIPYEFHKIKSSKVELLIPEFKNGTVTADKDTYEIGDTVNLTVTAADGYMQKLYIGDEPLLLDYITGQYSFVATENTYEITGSFEPKENWFWTADWNLSNQGHNIAHAPAHTSGEKTGELVPEKGVYSGVSVLVKDPSYGDQKDYAIVLKMHFVDGQKAEVRLIDRDDNGKYCLQAMGDSFSNWTTLYWLTAEENAEVVNGHGVWYGMTRVGTTLRLLIDGIVVKEIDMSANGITVDIAIDQIKIQAYNFGYEVDVPYEFITNPDDASQMSNVVTYVEGANDLFYRNDNISNLPDPFVLNNTAVDGYYYLYGTWGAFRCYRSKNLMDWELRGEVLYQYRENNKVWDGANNAYSYGVLGYDLWAPEVVYDPDTGLYYMFFSASPSKQGQAVIGVTTQMTMVATCTTPDGNFQLVNFKDANSCGASNLHTYSKSTYSHYYAPYLFLDPAQNKIFSTKINNGQWRGALDGREGYAGSIDPHPYVAPDGKKYLFWVDSTGEDRICGVEMENWLKPKWETATVVTYYGYYTIADYQNGSNNNVSYEYRTTTNEGPFVTFHNGKYYLTYSANNWKNNSYLVAQAISDSVLGPYTKLTEAEGGIVLSGVEQGGTQSTGVGHHSIVSVDDQLFVIYHRHTDSYTGTVNDPSGDTHAKRNHAIDEIKWITVNGREVMYVNGPNVTLQPRVEKHSEYHNIADEATVTGSVSNVNLSYLNDGLLSHLKNGHANVTNAAGETTITGTATFTFSFDEARTVKSIMVYNSRQEKRIFREIAQMKLVCLEDGKTVTKYIRAIPFHSEYFTVNSAGTVTYVEPCSAAYALFDEVQVLSVEITVKVPVGQTEVGISEIKILGK